MAYFVKSISGCYQIKVGSSGAINFNLIPVLFETLGQFVHLGYLEDGWTASREAVTDHLYNHPMDGQYAPTDRDIFLIKEPRMSIRLSPVSWFRPVLVDGKWVALIVPDGQRSEVDKLSHGQLEIRAHEFSWRLPLVEVILN